MNHDEPDSLRDDYRRASAADAGRPSAAARQAILAEAAAAARRRTSAANQPRYWTRAVAGIAVVGMGVLLWRQMDHRLPGQDAVITVPGPAEVPTGTQQSPLRPEEARDEAAPAPAAPPAAPLVADRAAREEAPPPAPEPFPAAAESAARSGLPRSDATAGNELAEMQVSGARVQSPRQLPDIGTLLREQFPQLADSATPRRVWLVLDARGTVRMRGEFAAGEDLATAAARLQQQLDATPGPWQVETVRNARGQPIEVSIARLQ